MEYGAKMSEVHPLEGVGLCAEEIVPVDGCWRDEAWVGGRGCYGGWERLAGRRIKATILPNKTSAT